MDLIENSCKEFIELLSSSKPAPGGGEVSAFLGAQSAALISMAVNIALNNKAYLNKKEENEELNKKIKDFKYLFLDLIEEDKRCFLPLLKAFSIKAKSEEEKREKTTLISDLSIKANEAQIKVIEFSFKLKDLAIKAIKTTAQSTISDIAIAIELLIAAIKCADLNLRINLKNIKNEEYQNNYKLLNKKIESNLEELNGIYSDLYEII